MQSTPRYPPTGSRRFCSDVERSGALLRSAGRRHWLGSGRRQRIPYQITTELFNQTTHAQYQPWKNGPWFGFNWRYDSGLVSGPVPCAGGNCNNGPNGDDTTVDVSGLTPDQQFEGGLYCGSVHATPTTSISATGLCPASQYGSTLIKIPAAGTEDDDHNPPRIASRNLFDLAVGQDNLLKGDKYKLSARLTVINLAEQRSALCLPFHFQRDSLCYAPHGHSDPGLSFLVVRGVRSPCGQGSVTN